MIGRIGTAVLLIGLAGCLGDEINGPSIRNKPIEVPKLPEASIASALRVDQVGHQLMSQSLFLGVEPTFHTYGQKSPEIFHPDLNGIFVTEGLVNQCKTDDELAAVLALELATMAAERRAASRLRDEQMPSSRDAGTVNPGSISSDLNQLGTQAMIDRRPGQSGKSKHHTVEDPRANATELMKLAGFDPKALDQVSPLLRQASGHHDAEEGLGGRPTRPRWSN